MFRCGLKNDLIPEYKKIDRKDGELPVAIEIKMEILEWADKNDLEMLKYIFMTATLDTLIHIGKKYELPIDLLILMRLNYPDLPNSAEECLVCSKKTIEHPQN